MSSARNLYRLNLALAALGALAVLAGTGVALARLDFGHLPAARLLSYCQRFLFPHTTPGGLAVLGLGCLGAAVALPVLVLAAAAYVGRRTIRARIR